MAPNRYAGLTRGFMLATAISVTLGGCASVEYDKVADKKTNSHVVPMPKAATETAYAGPAGNTQPVSAAADATAANNAAAAPQVPTVMMAQVLQPDGTLVPAQPAPAVGTSGQVMTGTEVASAGNTNPLVPGAKNAGMELAYAPPALVAIPQPRPDIIAAANSLPTPTDAEAVQTAALSGTQPNSALKDVEGLDQRLASADPAPGNPNPLTADVAVPTPRPGAQSMGLEAYANTPTMMALDAFDTSSPEKLEEPAIAPSGKLQGLIKKYAALYQVPEALVHRVVKRESNYNPGAYSRGNYGLMQIRYNTARSLGYTGSPSGLLDAETNLKYAVKYLRGAFMVAENNHDNAVRLYARGYYFDAKRKGLLALVQ